MRGVDLKTVQELLGHKSIEMTMRYSHLSPSHKKRAVNLLDRQSDTLMTPSGSTDKTEENDKISKLLNNIELANENSGGVTEPLMLS
jgi:hypothetical protein